MLDEVSTNVAEAIPFRNFKEMIRIVKGELERNRYVEIWYNDRLIYSAEKWKNKKDRRGNYVT